jgi:hypothetical protein
MFTSIESGGGKRVVLDREDSAEKIHLKSFGVGRFGARRFGAGRFGARRFGRGAVKLGSFYRARI